MINTIISVFNIANKYPDRDSYITKKGSTTYSILWNNTLSMYEYLMKSDLNRESYIWIRIRDGGLYLSVVMASFMAGVNTCLINDELFFDSPQLVGDNKSPDCLLNDEIVLANFDELVQYAKPTIIISDTEYFSPFIEGVIYKDCRQRTNEKLDYFINPYEIPKDYMDLKIIFFISATTSNSKAVISKYGQLNFSELDMEKDNPQINIITRSGYIKPFFCNELSTLQEGNSIFFIDINNDEQIRNIQEKNSCIDHLMTNLYGAKRFAYIAKKYVTSFPTIKSVTITGGAILRKNKVVFEKKFPNAVITDMYGQTELGAISSIENSEWLESPYCVGYPTFFVKVQIMDSNKILPEGTIGDICVTSNFAYERYLNKECRKEEYVITGDMGYMNEGKLYFLGRKSEKLEISDNIYFVRQVEEAVSESLDDIDTAVFCKDSNFYIYVVTKDLNIIKKLELALNKISIELKNHCKIIFVDKISYSKTQKPVLLN